MVEEQSETVTDGVFFTEETFAFIQEAPDGEVKALIHEHMMLMHPTDPACLHRRTVVALNYVLGLRRNVAFLQAKVERDGDVTHFTTKLPGAADVLKQLK